jgi:hypothetical protein
MGLMTRLLLARGRLLAAVLVATAATGALNPGIATAARPSSGLTNVGAGVSVVRPEGWQLFAPRITALTFPADRLLLTSYPTGRGGNCSPDRAEQDLPADGALIYLLEYRPSVGAVWTDGRHRSNFPPRPAHFRLRKRDLGNYECWSISSYMIRFRAADRPFQLHVALGPHTTAARRAQVLRTLDSLRFSALPAPPPDPYAGWHELHTETGDTLRTPPTWTASVTPSPRRHPQPRTLFLTANSPLLGLSARRNTSADALPSTFPAGALAAFPDDGVLFWIREDTPGPATTTWPRLPDRAWPTATDFTPVTGRIADRWPRLHWLRASAQQRNTRYSLWIISGPAATDADQRLAIKSAARFGFSVGSFRNRPCRRTCETGRPVQTIPAPVSAAGLEHAIHTKPGTPAIATCHAATNADRHHARTFANTHRLFICQIALRGQPPAVFDVQVLANGCYVAERRRRGQADYGCAR